MNTNLRKNIYTSEESGKEREKGWVQLESEGGRLGKRGVGEGNKRKREDVGRRSFGGRVDCWIFLDFLPIKV